MYDIRAKPLPMSASVVGLVIHLVFFAIGVYLYLYARGILAFGSEEVRKRAEAFRTENATWMRLLGLALAAVMLLNLYYDVRALLAG